MHARHIQTHKITCVEVFCCVSVSVTTVSRDPTAIRSANLAQTSTKQHIFSLLREEKLKWLLR